MKSTRWKQLATIALLTTSAMFAHSTGAPVRETNAPGEGNCTDCHIGNVVNLPNLTITFPDPNGYQAGQKYRLRVTLTDPTAKRWGFELTNRKEATTIFAGAF